VFTACGIMHRRCCLLVIRVRWKWIVFINVTQYTSAQSCLFLSKALLKNKKDYADVYCVTLIELQAHRDAFIQNTASFNFMWFSNFLCSVWLRVCVGFFFLTTV